MFTGIVLGLGTIKQVSPKGKGLKFFIEPDFKFDEPQLGESIAVNGVCLTATEFRAGGFSVDVSPETLSRTTLGRLKAGSRVNLERALRLSDRLGGHLVSGHVDAVAVVSGKRPMGDFTVWEFSIDPACDRYIIEKGSIAIDGISLTVNTCSPGRFSVAIIPHTAKLTTMGFRKPGDQVNIELDIVGKYIEKLLRSPAAPDEQGPKGPKGGLDKDLLARYGFL